MLGAGQGWSGRGRAGQGWAGQRAAGLGRNMPVRLNFDVLAQHVESHLLAGLNVILQGCICGRCVNAIRPVSLHTSSLAFSSV